MPVWSNSPAVVPRYQLYLEQSFAFAWMVVIDVFFPFDKGFLFYHLHVIQQHEHAQQQAWSNDMKKKKPQLSCIHTENVINIFFKDLKERTHRARTNYEYSRARYERSIFHSLAVRL